MSLALLKASTKISLSTSAKGDISTARILVAFLSRGAAVSVPWGNCQRYDLVLDTGNRLLRVQVKTARYLAGAVEFKSCSTSAFNKSRRHYGREEVDLFAVYSPHNDKIYIVPQKEVTRTVTRLRLDHPKNGQQLGVRDARAYEIDAVWNKLIGALNSSALREAGDMML